MKIEKIEYRIGGKIPKQKLRRVASTPYYRPPKRTSCRIWRAREASFEAEGRGWFSKLFDSAARFIVGTVAFFSTSCFGKGIGDSAGENVATIGREKTSFEMKEQNENYVDITLSIRYDGSEASKQKIISNIDSIFQLKEQPNQIHKENFDSDAIFLLKQQPKQIHKKSFDSPTEIDSAYLKYEPQKTIMKPRGRSSLYKMARSPYFGSSMSTNPKKYYPLNNNTLPSSTISFGHRQALKRRRSNRDTRCFDGIRRVRQKACLTDLNSFSNNDCQKQNKSNEFDGPSNRGYKTPLSDVLYAPPQSIERANKILYELYKL